MLGPQASPPRSFASPPGWRSEGGEGTHRGSSYNLRDLVEDPHDLAPSVFLPLRSVAPRACRPDPGEDLARVVKRPDPPRINVAAPEEALGAHACPLYVAGGPQVRYTIPATA